MSDQQPGSTQDLSGEDIMEIDPQMEGVYDEIISSANNQPMQDQENVESVQVSEALESIEPIESIEAAAEEAEAIEAGIAEIEDEVEEQPVQSVETIDAQMGEVPEEESREPIERGDEIVESHEVQDGLQEFEEIQEDNIEPIQEVEASAEDSAEKQVKEYPTEASDSALEVPEVQIKAPETSVTVPETSVTAPEDAEAQITAPETSTTGQTATATELVPQSIVDFSRRTSESIPLQFALTTPLKSLPALKDIEKITTPKPFAVARDADDSVIMESSPMIQKGPHNQQEDRQQHPVLLPVLLLDLDPDLTLLLASLIGCSPSDISSLPQSITSTLTSKLSLLANTTSEISFLKINQEQMTQIQEKKSKVLQSKINKLQDSSTKLQQERDQFNELNSQLTEKSNAITQENSNLLNQLSSIQSKQDSDTESTTKQLQERDQEISKLYEQVTSLTKNNVEINTKLSQLSKELNDSKNDKFSIQLTLNKSNNELSYTKTQKLWFENELKSVQERYTELIKKHETEYIINNNKLTKVTAQRDALELTGKSSSEHLSELNKEIETISTEKAKISSELDSLKQKFQTDIQSKQDLLDLVQVQSNERNSRIVQLEKYIDEIKSKFTHTIDELESKNKQQGSQLLIISEKLKRTEEILDEELRKETDLPKLNLSAEKLAGMLAGGMSLSSLYTEFSHLKKQLVMERSQKEKLAHQLETFIEELEAKKPAISNYKEQIRFYEDSLKDSFDKIEAIRIEKLDNEKFTKTLSNRVNGLENELVSMKLLCKDLGRQLCFYLIHSKIRDSQEDPLTITERKAIENILAKSGNNNQEVLESDTDKLISERLVGFASIIDLQNKNQELLTVVRQLGKQLENKDAEFSRDIESVAIEEAKEAILTLQSELETVNIKLDSVEKERNVFKKMVKDGGVTSSTSDSSTVSLLQDSNKDLRHQLKSYEDLLNNVRKQSEDQIKGLNAKLRSSEEAKASLSLKLNNLQHNVNLTETRFKNSEATLRNIQLELSRMKTDSDFWRKQTSKQESSFIDATNKLRNSENELSRAQIEIRNLTSEKSVWKSLEQSLDKDINQLKTDKAQLSEFVTNLQLLLKDREDSSKQFSDRLNQSIDNYQKLQDKLNEKEERIMILSSQTELSMKAQNTKLEQLHELSQLLVDTRLKLTEKTSEIERLENKIEILQTRAISNGATSASSDSTSAGVSSNGEVGDEKLLLEIDTLRKELRISEKQVNEFASIAKSAEEALVNSTSAFDEYKSETEKQKSALENAKSLLDQEIKQLRNTLQQSKEDLVLQRQQSLQELESLKSESQQFKLKADAYDDLQRDYEVKLQSIGNDLQVQINLVSDFQAKYQEELRTNDNLSTSVNQLKSNSLKYNEEINKLKEELLSVKTELNDKLDSVEEIKQSTVEELAKVNVKVQDLTNQNQILLNQLELKKTVSEGDESDDTSSLREVVNYLRHEKESAEAKLNLQLEEQQRLELKLKHLNLELESTKSDLRKALNSSVEVASLNKEHEKLLEQIQQLNILRESNTTLRNENKTNIGNIQRLNVDMAALKAQLQPLQKKVLDLTNDVDIKDQSIKLVKEELDRYKQKLVDAAQDPTGVVTNTAELDALKTENESAKKESEELQNKIKLLENELKGMTGRFDNLKGEAQEKLKRRSAEVKELRDTIEGLKKNLETVTEEASKLKSEAVNATTVASNEDENLQSKINTLETEKLALVKQISDLQNRLKKSEANAAEFTKLKTDYETKLKEATSATEEVRKQISKEYEAKHDELYKSIKESLEKENETALTERLSKIEGNEGIREELRKQFEAETSKLKEGFNNDLENARQETRKLSEKTTELRVKMLNKKIAKLTEQLAASKKAQAQVPPNSLPQTPTPQNVQAAQVKIQPNQNVAVNNRPAIDRAAQPQNGQNGQKRPFGGNNPNPVASKKPKE